MSKQTIVLADHRKDWSNLRPLTLTKPLAFLRIGILTIQEKWNFYFENSVKIKTTEQYLKSFNTFDPNEKGLIYINPSVLPNDVLVENIKKLSAGESLYSNGTLIASKIGNEDVVFEKAIQYSHEIIKINFPWDLFTLNEKAIELDYKLITKNRISAPISKTNTIIGSSENIFLEKDAKIEASILNTNGGFIYLAKNAEIMEGSVVRGSLAMCESATLKLSTKIYGATTIGPHSKVGGEVNNSLIQGFSNKGHDGFLGNAVIGEWCNLGADTNNSNLKNNYGEVKAYNYDKEDFIKTGKQFLGLIMGDHTKCGINTMFNTGTVAGVFANIFGGNFPPKYIPSYSWGGADGFTTYHFEKAMEVAEAVMQRRNKKLNENQISILKHLFENK
ncbi:MAG: GlmU family protein [Chitinophagales bacterium]